MDLVLAHIFVNEIMSVVQNYEERHKEHCCVMQESWSSRKSLPRKASSMTAAALAGRQAKRDISLIVLRKKN
jgi:hypothetical protein